MAQVPDPSLWQWLSEHLWAPFLGLIAVWWSMLQNRIVKVEKLADDAVTGEEFMGYVARSDKNMDDMKRDIGQIFELFREHDKDDRNRHEEILNTMYKQHTEVLDYLLQRHK